MSAVCTTPTAPINNTGVIMSTQQTLRPDLQEVVKDVLALKAMAKKDNFLTHRSQRAILNRLNAKDLAAVARVIAEADKSGC
ncbi:MAG TPA: hypothetical protein VI386_17365 [Candidatus Sulfotelmatobacter sp.]